MYPPEMFGPPPVPAPISTEEESRLRHRELVAAAILSGLVGKRIDPGTATRDARSIRESFWLADELIRESRRP